ncbi:hypothetical protein AWE51_25725 [Aquimarina aggregata]|uniref:DUF4365 domain-containing protein n=1 Tax=Aquimarina aggregata TaxID=1642818 RepID=A0A162Z2A3_9FLAO|nr:DUF4365 domain-containing protein [Aquimarina aggregata]KZS39510.1 hypothetical protein AWE51_25725 [Aquimarina aggregata]
MDSLDNMKLPKSSEQEELEQLSKDKLRPLFDHKLFEVREETYRDKGIDLLIELKYKGNYTNFRFLVQLKATETKKPNVDGSYSWQIDTSNIQYLLNGGQPAYYICYVKEKNVFYYKQLNELVTEISSKNEDWNNQETHTLRISKKLDSSSISEIYNKVKTRCQLSRELIEKLDIKGKKNNSTKISISDKHKITDEASIVRLVEKIGFTIINEGRSKEVVLLNEKISNDIKSPLYNLIVGVAHYYTSHLFDSLAFFQKAKRQKNELSKDLAENLEYFDTIIKFSLGLIDEKKYQEIIDSLKDSEHLKYYIKLENTKNRYFESLFSDEGFEVFKNELSEIINYNKLNSNIKFIAKCEYILYWGKKINMDFFQSTSRLNALGDKFNGIQEQRIKSANYFISRNKEWSLYCQELNKEISQEKDFFAFNMSTLNQAKVRFELIVLSEIIQEYNNTKSAVDNKETLENILRNLKTVSNNYRDLQHIENLLSSLSAEYEVSHYMKKDNEIASISKEMNDLAEFHDLKESKAKIDFLLNGGTIQEHLVTLFQNTVEKSDDLKKEHLKLVDEMKALDKLEEDKILKDNESETVIIELFPIGHFSIVRNQINEFYDILNIDSFKLIKHLDYFFDNGIIPVLNIFNEIKNEGYCNGMLDDKGIESWRKIKEIRFGLYEKEFRRQKINTGYNNV